MAVVLIILSITAITMGVVGYVQKKVAITNTRALIASMESALELYKNDWGYYPQSFTGRVSSSGGIESLNNWLLLRALSGNCANCKKVYMRVPPSLLKIGIGAGSTNILTSTNGNLYSVGGFTNICDPWGLPYNYYCAPKTPFGIMNNVYAYPTNVNANNAYSCGGQVNIGSFDLFSYGPDRVTYVAPNLAYGSWGDGPWVNTAFKSTSSALDDITNFGR